MTHPSHKTRMSDSSLYDEVCTFCGTTDSNGRAALDAPCPATEAERARASYGHPRWRCGDVVRHSATGNRLTVAYADHAADFLSAYDSPMSSAGIGGCVREHAASDAEFLRAYDAVTGGSGPWASQHRRATECRRLHGAEAEAVRTRLTPREPSPLANSPAGGAAAVTPAPARSPEPPPFDWDWRGGAPPTTHATAGERPEAAPAAPSSRTPPTAGEPSPRTNSPAGGLAVKDGEAGAGRLRLGEVAAQSAVGGGATPGEAADSFLGRLRAANQRRDVEWNDGDERISLLFRAVEMAGEAGEACNVAKKLERERLGMRGSRATLQDLADELADVAICVDLIAMHAGIDLSTAITAKFNATSEKYGLSTRLVAAATAPAEPTLCIACAGPMKTGDPYYPDRVNGGVLHAACCGTEPEYYVDENDEPLRPGDRRPEPSIWREEA